MRSLNVFPAKSSQNMYDHQQITDNDQKQVESLAGEFLG